MLEKVSNFACYHRLHFEMPLVKIFFQVLKTSSGHSRDILAFS